jgi:competence CoiA-like predicted nuclease
VPLKARCVEYDKEILSFELPADMQKPKQFTWECPHCQSEMLYVDATMKVKHFRHDVKGDCNYKPESELHLKTKELLYKKLKQANSTTFIDVEHKVEGVGYPDVFLITQGKEVAVEIELSNGSFNHWFSKTLGYTSRGIYSFWVTKPPVIVNNHRLRLNALQRLTNRMNDGRFYWCDNLGIHATHPQYIKRTKTIAWDWVTIDPSNFYLVKYEHDLPYDKRLGTDKCDFLIPLLIARPADSKFW